MHGMHSMVDLETLDTAPTALAWSIGATAFDQDRIKASFYRIIKIDDFMIKNFTISASTLNWMFSQPEILSEIRKAYSLVHTALHDFAAFYHEHDCENLWGNGNVILGNMYDKTGIARPWRYNHNRCFRTVKALYPQVVIPANIQLHNAAADAKHQTEYLIALNKAHSLNIL